MPVITAHYELFEKIRSLEEEWRILHGHFTLFALIERDDVPAGYLDIVVSAPWIVGERPFLQEFIPSIHSKLTREEFLSISRFIVLPDSEPFIQKLVALGEKYSGVERDSNLELRDITVNGVPIKHAYIIASSKEETSEALLHS